MSSTTEPVVVVLEPRREPTRAIWGAGSSFNLPYHHARISFNRGRRGEHCSQDASDPPTARFRGNPTAEPPPAVEPGTLDIFLVERYACTLRARGRCIGAQVPRGRAAFKRHGDRLTRRLLRTCRWSVGSSAVLHFARGSTPWSWSPERLILESRSGLRLVGVANDQPVFIPATVESARPSATPRRTLALSCWSASADSAAEAEERAQQRARGWRLWYAAASRSRSLRMTERGLATDHRTSAPRAANAAVITRTPTELAWF